MDHFDEGRVYGNSLLDVEENHSSFGLCVRSHDGADGLKFGEYRSIRGGSSPDVGRWWVVTQVVVACSATARFGMNKICCVAVDVEAHVPSVEPDDGVQLRGCAVHQNLRFLDGVGVGRSLLGANLVECDNHGGVDGTRDVEKGSVDDLHAHDAAFIKFRCGRGVGRVLQLSPVCRHEPFVGRVLGARGYGVLEALQGFTDGVGHGYVNVIVRVIPIDGKSVGLAARRVDGDGVILPECVEEVGGIVGGQEFDPKVIYSKGEGGG